MRTVSKQFGSLRTVYDELQNKVSKSGDTMTGDLVLKNTDEGQDDEPSPSSYVYINWTDKDDIRIAQARSVISETETGLYIAGQRTVNDSTLLNGLGLYIDASGNYRIAFQNAAVTQAWQRALRIAPTDIASGTNLNNLYEDGLYKCTSTATAGTLTNAPSVGSAFFMLIMSVSTEDAPSTSTAKMQVIFNGQYIWARRRTTTSWGSWYRYTGTAV